MSGKVFDGCQFNLVTRFLNHLFCATGCPFKMSLIGVLCSRHFINTIPSAFFFKSRQVIYIFSLVYIKLRFKENLIYHCYKLVEIVLKIKLNFG